MTLEIVPGHVYRLRHLDGSDTSTLTFVSRVGEKFPGNRDAFEGTTSQEVVDALIKRARYVNAQTRCWQTTASICALRFVLWLYEHRNRRKKGLHIESAVRCDTCLHIYCDGH